MLKITILGNGNMAFAIAQGLAEKYSVEIVGRNLEKLKNLQKRLTNIQIVEYGENFSIQDKNIILAFKPNNLEPVSNLLNGQAENLFSVLAGTKIATLKNSISAKNYIRTMPNLSAKFQKSMTSITGDLEAKNLALDIFSTIGETLWLESEDEVDIATAIAGSGPAYLSLVAEALADGGVKAGLKRASSEKLVSGLFSGFAPLLENEKASNIKDGVMSPKGTTAYGYSTLEENGVRFAFIQAVQSAYQRAVNLGQKVKK